MGGHGYIFIRLVGNPKNECLRVYKPSVIITEDRVEAIRKFEQQMDPGQLLAVWNFTPSEEFPGIGLHNVMSYVDGTVPTTMHVRAEWQELLRLDVSDYSDDIVV